MPEGQHRETWSRQNHLWAGDTDDEGYAVCRNCEHPENSKEAAKPCVHGPATSQVLNELITLTARFMKLEKQLAESEERRLGTEEWRRKYKDQLAERDREIEGLRNERERLLLNGEHLHDEIAALRTENERLIDNRQALHEQALKVMYKTYLQQRKDRQ